ncbi:hypothetical protein BGZ61DRAFT_359358, partial [Ilyonectria robusta]|uniref:uncharacterized protein n=1 Tax=Ilyonectria robusta TaxID=1079257 RepID=UPI001E8E4E0E
LIIYSASIAIGTFTIKLALTINIHLIITTASYLTQLIYFLLKLECSNSIINY